jgi:predicted secreted protein
LKLSLAFASAFGIAVPVSAQGSTPAAPVQAAKPADPMSEIVCQKQEIVGSRLATRRVCMTRHQWQEQRSIDRQDTEKAQTPSAQNTPG